MKLQEFYRNYFAREKNIRLLKADKILIDITDKEKIFEIIKAKYLENNHQVINEVFEEIKKEYYYPKLQTLIQKYINNCEICNLAKFDRAPLRHSLNVTENPKLINDIIHCDAQWFHFIHFLEKNRRSACRVIKLGRKALRTITKKF